MTPDFRSFAAACARIGLELPENRYRLLCRYADLLLDWNRRVNLVSRQDTGRVLSYHVIDSLAAQSLVPAGARAGDIGTGAGLPGIPLAIARPDCEFLLVESVRKKTEFLSLVLDELRLANAGVIHDRAEDIPPLDCDTVLSRLTGPTPKTLPRLAAHARTTGTVVLYKSPAAAPDLPAGLLRKLRLRVARTEDLRLPLTGLPRRFIVLASA